MVAAVSFPTTTTFGEGEIQPLESDITIDGKDKECTSDADCVVVSIRCGDCGLDAVNEAYVSRYKAGLANACKDNKIECDTDYRGTHEVKCINAKCRLIPKKSPQP